MEMGFPRGNVPLGLGRFFVGLISTSVGIGAILLSKKEVYEKAVANKII